MAGFMQGTRKCVFSMYSSISLTLGEAWVLVNSQESLPQGFFAVAAAVIVDVCLFCFFFLFGMYFVI